MDSGKRLSIWGLRGDCYRDRKGCEPSGCIKQCKYKEDCPLRRRNSTIWQRAVTNASAILKAVCRTVTAESWKPFHWLYEVNYKRSLCLVLLMLKNYGLALICLNREAICQGHTFSRIEWKEINCKDFLCMLQIEVVVCNLLTWIFTLRKNW